MKWIYGKQDFKTLERAQENCFLMTNGLGGFSSLTMTGSASRNDHGVLMACVKAPNHRYHMIHRLRERLVLEKQSYMLSTQQHADGTEEKGFEYIQSFVYEDTPVWTISVSGVEIVKEMGMMHGKNAVSVIYKIFNRSRSSCRLEVVPFFQFVKKGSDMSKSQKFEITPEWVESAGMKLYYRTDGSVRQCRETERYFYSADACDGRREWGSAAAAAVFSAEVEAGGEGRLTLAFAVEKACVEAPDAAEAIVASQKEHRRCLEEKAGFLSPLASFFAKSADQFVSLRASTGGRTIIAGYPFFEDWGRDTMIALPGVCLSTGQYETARSILRTFAANEKDGLMPNLFPEGTNAPMYNTADAALLFINCVYLYEKASGDRAFVKEMWPVMKKIIDAYQKGTRFNIHMDSDGLIIAGSGLDQVTWMDVRVGEVLPTPRHGKPVEINAYWYNALKVMAHFADMTGDPKDEYQQMAALAKTSFVQKYPMADRGYLKDVLTDGDDVSENQLRCNQIWAVSMPFTMLDETWERRIVDIIFEKLYTPYGLRTLAMDDPQFHPVYGGPTEERDMAYHQGTVWTYPLGAYYLAYLKVHHDSRKAKDTVRRQLEVMESAAREGCIGQLPEIYDGKNPASSKGCFAQAWSVGEILRVYEALEK